MLSANLKKNVTVTTSFLIFIFITVVAIRYKEELSITLQQTDSQWLLIGLSCYFANYLARAYRIRCYSHKQLCLFPDIFRITCLHGFSSYFLPMRSGDLTLPGLLNVYHGIPLLQGSRILIRARLLDIFSLGLLLIVATLFSAQQLTLPWRLLFLFIGIVLTGVPYLLISLIKWKKEWLLKKFQQFKQQKDMAITYPSGKEVLQSLFIWFWTGCTTFCVIRSLGIPLAFLDTWFFAAIQLPLQLLPIQGLANSGNHEAGWLLTLQLLDITQVDVVGVTLSSHIILIGYVLLLGAVALLLPKKNHNNKSTS